jgi:MoxR-like ATPase
MPFHQFQGSGPIPNYQPPADRPPDPLRDPRHYRASPELVQAVNVALALRKPLLVTGEPGTGKTDLAYRIAAELNLGDVLRFDTKSSSQANDLFYHFDSVRQFAQIQWDVAQKRDLTPPQRFLRLQALAKAILRTLPQHRIPAPLQSVARHDAPGRSVVLVDELDKAPRDFPNDLLNQVENLEFTVPEIGLDDPVRADPQSAPLVVISSNSEKQLPEPFLRRCVYHHIEFPADSAELMRILGARLGGFTGQESFRDQLLDWFLKVRQDSMLEKKPSTAELLDWMRALQNQLPAEAAANEAERKTALAGSLGALFKTQADRRLGQERLGQL